MNAIEKRGRNPNPNVAVIHEAMQHFPKGSWMRGALDHAAAELAVLHGRCQRAALTPPEGYLLAPVIPAYEMVTALAGTAGCNLAQAALAYRDALAARPEVP